LKAWPVSAIVEVDYDSTGRVLAIEFPNANKKYDLDESELEDPDPYYSLASAGAMFGLSPTTLRHQIGRGPLRGTKFGRNWVVHRDDLEDYMGKRSRKAKFAAGVYEVSASSSLAAAYRSLGHPLDISTSWWHNSALGYA
jgi:hypothetical protein